MLLKLVDIDWRSQAGIVPGGIAEGLGKAPLQLPDPPMPLLFQRGIGSEHRAFTPTAIRKLLINALAATGLTNAEGEALSFSPHDFRRIFVTDAIMNGLPPHIAQVICGHKSVDTTIGYKAVYPAETIKAHRAFIARRRASRPGEEYRIPTEEEWDAFLAHFEKRKVSIGTAHAPSDPPASMSTLVSDARSSDLTRPNGHGLPTSATT
ncbi:site-specific integrase [Streptomyces sp. 900105755]